MRSLGSELLCATAGALVTARVIRAARDKLALTRLDIFNLHGRLQLSMSEVTNPGQIVRRDFILAVRKRNARHPLEFHQEAFQVQQKAKRDGSADAVSPRGKVDGRGVAIVMQKSRLLCYLYRETARQV